MVDWGYLVFVAKWPLEGLGAIARTSRQNRKPAEVVEREDSRRVPVRPKQLEGVAAHRFAPQQLEAARADLLDGTQHSAKRIRLALACGTRTGPPQKVEGQVDFLTALEGDREFRADDDRLLKTTHAG